MSGCQPNVWMPAPCSQRRRLPSLSVPYPEPHATTHGGRWKARKQRERAPATTDRPKMVRSIPFHRPDFCPLTRRSLQDALRTFFQPIKTEDSRVDFYTMYKRESAEHDMDYVKKYDEDLNTTLIFVRYLSPYLIDYLMHYCRLVSSPPSAPPSSSTSIRTSDPTLTNNPPPSSAPSSLLSTNPPFPASPPQFRPFRKTRRARS